MKKNLIAFISLATILLAWCNDSSVTKIDLNTRASDEWASAEAVYNQQIDEAQYIQDLEDFISYDILLNSEDKSFVSNISLIADFDSQSSLQWWVSFTQNKYSQSRQSENREITFDIRAEESQDDSEPFYASWSLSLVYQNDEVYANIHDFWVFMWEWNMTAKMYTLLWESLVNQWIDLDAHNGWIITINEKEDIKLNYILSTLRNVLKTEWINEDSPNFLNGVVELLDTANSYVDLRISTDGLTLVSRKDEYFQSSNGSIQRQFTGTFRWADSEFAISLTSSNNWLHVHLYDIGEFDEDVQYYEPTDSEFIFSIQENKKSNYGVKFQSLKARQIVADIDWNLKYGDEVKFSGKFILEPLELIQWQKISWNIEWTITKTFPNGDETIPEVSWKTISLTDILSSL